MKSAFFLLTAFLLCSGSFCQTSTRVSKALLKVSAPDSLRITTPTTRIVYQRNNANTAAIPVRGTAPQQAAAVEARLVARASGQGKTTGWQRIPVRNGSFFGTITGTGGWYDLEVRPVNKSAAAPAVMERVGIGEVFVVVGHSVAQGGDINIEGSADDRVSTVALQPKSEMNEQYLKTGDMQYLPEPVFVKAATDVALAPFGHNTYFWSKFGELLVQKENVPVLIYNAGFGGTMLDHWAKASQGQQFEHGFVKSGIRMPYINLYNALKKYIPLTGIRALLADHGQNDRLVKNPEQTFANYQTWFKQAKQDLDYPQLAMVVNRQTPEGSPEVRTIQQRMAKEPNCFPGPDYDTMVPSDKTDGIHLSEPGLRKAAVMWAAALTPTFFKQSKPWLPTWKSQ